MEIESMVDISEESINEARKYYPQWIVQLLHGDYKTATGIIVEREIVFKKWERVESLVASYNQKLANLSDEKREQWFVSVTEVIGVKRGFFIFD